MVAGGPGQLPLRRVRRGLGRRRSVHALPVQHIRAARQHKRVTAVRRQRDRALPAARRADRVHRLLRRGANRRVRAGRGPRR